MDILHSSGNIRKITNAYQSIIRKFSLQESSELGVI